MKDLEMKHSISRNYHYSFNQNELQQHQQHQRQHHQLELENEDDDSENMAQLPPPHHPLLEEQLLEQEKSISDDIMRLERSHKSPSKGHGSAPLIDRPRRLRRRRQLTNNHSINYCNNNIGNSANVHAHPQQQQHRHQSINNKPTDKTGLNHHHYYYYYDEEEEDEDAEEEFDYEHGDEEFQYNYDDDEEYDAKQNTCTTTNDNNTRSRATSSPIQVPARKARRDFYSMKLNMMKVEESAAAALREANENSLTGSLTATISDDNTRSSTNTTITNHTTEQQTSDNDDANHGREHHNIKRDNNYVDVDHDEENKEDEDEEEFSLVRRGDRNRPAFENMAAFDEDDAFLDREFNENHYNHYTLDGLDDEHLTAEEDPMRLFASIQALAKSLHEDAELFGSLPPKRMLESPIRSIAFV